MTMTTNTHTLAPKAQKALDAAKANGWTTEIVENSENYSTVTITHPDPVKHALAEIKLAFYSLGDGKWIFDGGTTRSANAYGKISYGTTKITLRDAMAVIEGQYSPRALAAQALEQMARKTRRDALQAAYEAETDGPERAQLRREVTARANAVSAMEKLAADTAEHKIEWAAQNHLEDALIERHMARLAARVLEWEGMVDEKGEHVSTLEEVVVRVADSALRGVLNDATRGTSGSTSLFVNVWKDVESVAKAKFVEAFHPIYGGYTAQRLLEDILDPKWLKHNGGW